MKKFQWGTTDRFVSNNGAGPYVARILSIADGAVTMERWHRKKPGRTTRFQLTVEYFMSPGCGWKKS